MVILTSGTIKRHINTGIKVAPQRAVPILQGRKCASMYTHNIEADTNISGRKLAKPLILGSDISVTNGITNVFIIPYVNPKQILGTYRNIIEVAKV